MRCRFLNAAQGCALPHFLQQGQGAIGIAEFTNAGFHGNANGDAHLDGIQTDIVIQEIEVAIASGSLMPQLPP